jgi:hypothetical protein
MLVAVLTMFLACLALPCLGLGDSSGQESLATRSVVPLDAPVEDAWVPDGPVRAIARTADKVYIGGDFTMVAPHTGTGVPLSSSTGQPIVPFPRVNGGINACVSDGSGGWYIGGDFTRVGGVARNRLARVLANGAVNLSWNPDADDEVFGLAVSGSTVYVGGDFAHVGGQPRNRIAALDTSTGQATSWNPDANSRVSALAVSGGTVYAGGVFTQIGGQSRLHIAALSATTGMAYSWNPEVIGSVRTVAVSDLTVYLGGNFSLVGGQSRNNIAAVNASTGLATTWNPDANGWVLALAVSDGTVYAGGLFTQVGVYSRNRIAAISASSGFATSWNPNADGWVASIVPSGTAVYVGGGFTQIGGQLRGRIAELNASTGIATSWNPNANGPVAAIVLSGSTVYAGGWYSGLGGQARNHIAALDVATGQLAAWNPDANGRVDALAVSGSTVYAGGLFTHIGGKSRSHIAALDIPTGKATSFDAKADGGVNALAVSDPLVFAGGEFSQIGGQMLDYIAALDASTGNAGEWNAKANDPVDALAVSGGTLYAGGRFTDIGGVARNRIAALDADTGKANTWNPNANERVYALAVSGSAVIAGGRFTQIGGQTRYRIASLDASTGNATGWNPAAGGAIRALGLSGTTVYVAGEFVNIGAESRWHIAALNGLTGVPTAWDPDADNGVYALAVYGSSVHAGGAFTAIGGDRRHYYAQFAAPDIILTDATFNPAAPSTVQPGSILTCSWTLSGPTGTYWLEVFPSKTGGFTLERIGGSLTQSYLVTHAGGWWAYAPGNQLLNWIPDGAYTVVSFANRAGTGGLEEEKYANNWFPIAGKRLSVRNTQTPVCDLSWYGTPVISRVGTNVTVSGTVRNIGTGASPAYGFWVEAFYGMLSPEGFMWIEAPIGAGQRVSSSLVSGAQTAVSLSGSAPSGRVVAVLIDSTDIVPETNEQNNWRKDALPPPQSGTVDLVVESVTIADAHKAPNELSPFSNLPWTCRVRNNSGVASGEVWIELFPSMTGGLDFLRSGITLTASQKISLAAGQTTTFSFNQPFERITDGIYTVVAVVNRLGTGGPVDPNPTNNMRAVSGRIVLRNTTTPASDLEWQSTPSITRSVNTVTVTGTIRNSGSAASGPFWTEAWYGTFDANGVFYAAGQIGGGQHTTNLAATQTAVFSRSGPVPSGVWAVGVITDATDLVPETDETDNYHYATP